MMSQDNKSSSIFIITGMHRSGTSLTASLMESAGVNIGERLMDAAPSNPKGHFENLDFVDFHKCALRSQGITQEGWTIQKGIHVPQQLFDKAKLIIAENATLNYWGWKDPRTTLFLDFWNHLLPQAYFIFTYRSPWEVIDSLYRRGLDEIFYSNPKYALQIWMHYNKIILEFYHQFPDKCILLNTETVIADYTVISKLCTNKFGLKLKEPNEEIVDKSLMSNLASNGHRPMLIKRFFPEAVELYNDLNNQADFKCQPVHLDPLEVDICFTDWLFQDWLDIYKIRKDSKRELERSQSQLQHTQTELERSQSQLQHTQTELERSQSQIQHTQTELERSQSQLQHTQAELERPQSQPQHIEVELERSQSNLQLTQAKLERSQSQLQLTQTELENWQHLVSWMETSKFWKARLIYLSFKNKINDINFPLIKLAIKISTVLRKKEGYRIFTKRALNLLKYHLMDFRTNISFIDILIAEFLRNFAESSEYQQWIKDNKITQKELEGQKINALSFSYKPVVSIILPVYKLPLFILKETINSILYQTYTRWELCIAFADANNLQTLDYLKALSLQEKRVNLTIMPENKGISGNSNVCLKMATGEFIALLDHDDLLSPSAFYEVINELNKQPDLDFIYSDKDCISANSMVRSRLLLKPEWSPEILYSANYLTHLCIARRDLVDRIGGFRPETDGAQDWDLFLRITEETSRIARIHSVLYHWRIIQGSTSLGIDSKPYALEAQLRSIQNHLSRTQLPAEVSPHPECGFRLEWKTPPAKVSIIIDGDVPWNSLSACINAVSEFADTSLHIVKIVLPESSYVSQASEREILLKTIKLPVDWLPIREGNSKLEILAQAASQDTTDVVVFVSGEVIRFNNGWIQELSGWVFSHRDIGFASALVLTDKNIVVESGLVVDKHGNGSPLMRGNNLYCWETFGGALWYRNCSACSPWSVAFSYEHYLNIGGLPIDSPSLSHAMIKLCQASRATNKRGLLNPHARAFLRNLPSDDISKFDESLADDPYFHPAFGSVVPLKLKLKNRR